MPNLASIAAELDRFLAKLDATTSVAGNGQRTIGPAPHAIALSQATAALHEAIGEAMPTALASGDHSLFAALVSASKATGWPIDRHNRQQAGGWPHRWEPGEILPADMLEAIEQAQKLLGAFPLRSGCDRPAPADVMDAVRKVIAGWDGVNWAAVRAVLANDGKSRADTDAMTLDDVRQYFAVGQNRITLALGGTPNTTTNTIVAIEPAEPRADGGIVETKPAQANLATIADDAVPVNAIDENDASILAFLNRTPNLRRKVSDVLPDNGPQDRKAVAARLRKLADRTPALVEYPKGGRSGVVILPAGVAALKQATTPR